MINEVRKSMLLLVPLLFWGIYSFSGHTYYPITSLPTKTKYLVLEDFCTKAWKCNFPIQLDRQKATVGATLQVEKGSET